MRRDGVLKVEQDKTRKYWIQAAADVRKGKLSARSAALIFRFPDKLERIHHVTWKNRRFIDAHFRSIGLPGNELDEMIGHAAPVGAVEKHALYLAKFIEAVQKLIPAHDVDYHYLAVRILIAYETDFQMDLAAEYMTRAFSSIRDEPAMRGWWHLEPDKYDKHRTVYHRPRQYDL
jgi:hypothetical protein